jgi:hypothetical protein
MWACGHLHVGICTWWGVRRLRVGVHVHVHVHVRVGAWCVRPARGWHAYHARAWGTDGGQRLWGKGCPVPPLAPTAQHTYTYLWHAPTARLRHSTICVYVSTQCGAGSPLA